MTTTLIMPSISFVPVGFDMPSFSTVSYCTSVVQGTADTDQTVMGAVVQRTTDFLAPAIILTRPELMEKVSKHLDPDILAPNAVNAITGNDEEANRVL